MKRRIKIWFLRLLKDNRFEKLTREQRQALIAFARAINYKDCIPTQMPDGSKCFVEHKPSEMLITVDFANKRIKIINHVFQYIIDMNERMAINIHKLYCNKTETLRNEVERKYDANVKNSLKKVIENL